MLQVRLTFGCLGRVPVCLSVGLPGSMGCGESSAHIHGSLTRLTHQLDNMLDQRIGIYNGGGHKSLASCWSARRRRRLLLLRTLDTNESD